MSEILLEDAAVEAHDQWAGGYFLLTLRSPRIAPRVKPGQFVHVRLPAPADTLLRRPFSVFRTDRDTLQLLYKPVGRGTHAMITLRPGDTLSLLGPLGRGFPPPSPKTRPVLVAGGYGMAALYLQAAACPRPGVAFFGGASRTDILCVSQFEALGWEVRVTTEDGSLGTKGLVTVELDRFLAEKGKPELIELFACGPNGMLKAVADRAERHGFRAWLSLDRNMGCGVGACLTCVQRVRAPDGTVNWMRVCREGPVFDSRDIIWEDES